MAKKFPDLSGDGKTTFKDVLIGRGVSKKKSIKKEGKTMPMHAMKKKKKKKKNMKKRVKAMGGGAGGAMKKRVMKRGGGAMNGKRVMRRGGGMGKKDMM